MFFFFFALQILNNLKIVTTALLYRLIIKKWAYYYFLFFFRHLLRSKFPILMNCFQWGSCLPSYKGRYRIINNFHHRNSGPFDPHLNGLIARPRIHLTHHLIFDNVFLKISWWPKKPQFILDFNFSNKGFLILSFSVVLLLFFYCEMVFLFLSREISGRKWVAIFLLFLGGTINRLI